MRKEHKTMGQMPDNLVEITTEVFSIFKEKNIPLEDGVLVLCNALALLGDDIGIETVINDTYIQVTQDKDKIKNMVAKADNMPTGEDTRH